MNCVCGRCSSTEGGRRRGRVGDIKWIRVITELEEVRFLFDVVKPRAQSA